MSAIPSSVTSDQRLIRTDVTIVIIFIMHTLQILLPSMCRHLLNPYYTSSVVLSACLPHTGETEGGETERENVHRAGGTRQVPSGPVATRCGRCLSPRSPCPLTVASLSRGPPGSLNSFPDDTELPGSCWVSRSLQRDRSPRCCPWGKAVGYLRRRRRRRRPGAGWWCRRCSGNTLCGRSGPQRSAAPSRTRASCRSNRCRCRPGSGERPFVSFPGGHRASERRAGC